MAFLHVGTRVLITEKMHVEHGSEMSQNADDFHYPINHRIIWNDFYKPNARTHLLDWFSHKNVAAIQSDAWSDELGTPKLIPTPDVLKSCALLADISAVDLFRDIPHHHHEDLLLWDQGILNMWQQQRLNWPATPQQKLSENEHLLKTALE